MADMDKIYTLEAFVSEGLSSSIIKYDNLLFFEKTKSGELLPFYNVFNDYTSDILKAAVTVELNDKEYIKYRFKPRLLCYDTYGSQDIYYIILLLNNICNIRDFNMRKIKMLKSSDMEYLLSSIYNAEHEYLTNNLSIVKNK